MYAGELIDELIKQVENAERKSLVKTTDSQSSRTPPRAGFTKNALSGALPPLGSGMLLD
jgi:hypothetical protein